MRLRKVWAWGFAVALAAVDGCSTTSNQVVNCDSDTDCEEGQVCGTEDCSGLLYCLPAGCECTPNGFRNPCQLPSTPQCSCDAATCERPLDSCGKDACPGACKLGESCQFCLEGPSCDLANPCLGSFCTIDAGGAAKCRPAECLNPAVTPPLCGSDDAPCGEVCFPPNCDGRECDEDLLLGMSCGTCGAHRYCVDGHCRQDPQYLLCSGELVAMDEEVVVHEVTGNSPEPAGGIISDGIYDLVEEREYGQFSISDVYSRGALRFFAGATQVEHIYDAIAGSQADDESPHRLLTVSADGTTLSFHVTCPDEAHVIFPNYTRGFTAQGDDLWLIQPQLLEIYKRRAK